MDLLRIILLINNFMEIAIIAHDGKKEDLVKFLLKNKMLFALNSLQYFCNLIYLKWQQSFRYLEKLLRFPLNTCKRVYL